MYLDWNASWEALPALLEGARLTLTISVLGFLLSIPLALVVAALRVAPRPLNWVGATYVEALRNTPLLLQIFFLYYGLPTLGIHIPTAIIGVFGLMVNLAAYLAEIFRGGIAAVPHGMREAAAALGMSRSHTYRHIVLPVAMRLVYPATCNLFIMGVLASSLLSVIAIPELTGQTNAISARTFRTVEIYSVSTVIYLAITVGGATLLWLAGKRLFRGQLGVNHGL